MGGGWGNEESFSNYTVLYALAFVATIVECLQLFKFELQQFFILAGIRNHNLSIVNLLSWPLDHFLSTVQLWSSSFAGINFRTPEVPRSVSGFVSD